MKKVTFPSPLFCYGVATVKSCCSDPDLRSSFFSKMKLVFPLKLQLLFGLPAGSSYPKVKQILPP